MNPTLSRGLCGAVCLLALLGIPGCDRATDEPARKAAAAPPSPDIERVLVDLRALIPDAARRSAIDREVAQWSSTRIERCAAISSVGERRDDAPDAGKRALEACLSTADRQQLATLLDMKLILLLQQPLQERGEAGSTRLSAALEPGSGADALLASPDGDLLALGTVGGTVDILDARTGNRLRSLPADKRAVHLAFSPNGRLLVTAGRGASGLKFWDPRTGDLLRTLDEGKGPFAFVGEHDHLVYADDDRLRIYEIATNRVLPTKYANSTHALKLLAAPDRKSVAVLSIAGGLSRWLWLERPGTAEPELSRTHDASTQYVRGYAGSVEFSGRDGSVLLTLDSDGQLARWNTPDLQRTRVTVLGPTPGSRLCTLGPDLVALFGGGSGPGAYVIFYRPESETAARTNLDATTSQALLASAPGGTRLYVVTDRRLTELAPPASDQFQPVQTLISSLVAEGMSFRVGQPTTPMLKGVAPNARVEAIGVYEGNRTESGVPTLNRDSQRTAHPVTINIGRVGQPLVLVLASYEPVQWRVVKAQGVNIQHVLLSGYYDSRVEGAEGAEVTRISAGYSYQFGDSGYRTLVEQVQRTIGREIERFQGAYTGSEFQIGALGPQSATSRTAGAYKCVDAQGKATYVDRPCDELDLRQAGMVKAPPAPAPVPPAAPAVRARSSDAATTRRVDMPRNVVLLPDGKKIIRCGKDAIVCTESETIVCGGKTIRCE